MRSWQWMAVCGVAVAATAGLTSRAMAQEVPALVDKELPGLLTTYKGLHTAPELSHHEAQTSALLADELRKAGYTVTERVGKYPDGSQAYGVVGILKNGAGPTLLIRADSTRCLSPKTPVCHTPAKCDRRTPPGRMSE